MLDLAGGGFALLRGGSARLRGGSVLLRGGSALLRGGSALLRGGSARLRGGFAGLTLPRPILALLHRILALVCRIVALLRRFLVGARRLGVRGRADGGLGSGLRPARELRPEALAQLAGLLVIGLATQHVVEHGDGSLEVTLRGVDLGERDRRQRRRRRRPALGAVADRGGGVGEVEALLHDCRDQIARSTEPAPGPRLVAIAARRALEDLVDQLRLREDARARHARALGLHDELFSGQCLKLVTLHGGVLSPGARRLKLRDQRGRLRGRRRIFEAPPCDATIPRSERRSSARRPRKRKAEAAS